jgi:hypothetical protein
MAIIDEPKIVKESEQIDFLKLKEKKYENLIDFVFGFAR